MTEHPPIPKHSWNEIDEIRVDGHDLPDGNSRTIKTCSKCGLKKITVHPPQGFPFNEWIFPNGDASRLKHTPPCVLGAPDLRKAEDRQACSVPNLSPADESRSATQASLCPLSRVSTGRKR